jgi:hypothetical protein
MSDTPAIFCADPFLEVQIRGIPRTVKLKKIEIILLRQDMLRKVVQLSERPQINQDSSC